MLGSALIEKHYGYAHVSAEKHQPFLALISGGEPPNHVAAFKWNT
jgi:hypothetical protein